MEKPTNDPGEPGTDMEPGESPSVGTVPAASADRRWLPGLLYVTLIIACVVALVHYQKLLPVSPIGVMSVALLAALLVGVVFSALVRESDLPWLQSEKLTIGGSIGAFALTFFAFVAGHERLSETQKKLVELELEKTLFAIKESALGTHERYAEVLPGIFGSSPSPVPMTLALAVGCADNGHRPELSILATDLGNGQPDVNKDLRDWEEQIYMPFARGRIAVYSGDTPTEGTVATLVYDNSHVLAPKIRLTFGIATHPCERVEPVNVGVDDLETAIETLREEDYLRIGTGIDRMPDATKRQRLTGRLYELAVEYVSDNDNPWLLLLGQLSHGWSGLEDGSGPRELYAAYHGEKRATRRERLEQAIYNMQGSLKSCILMPSYNATEMLARSQCFTAFARTYPVLPRAIEARLRATGIDLELATMADTGLATGLLRDVVGDYSSMLATIENSSVATSANSNDHPYRSDVLIFRAITKFLAANREGALADLEEIDLYTQPVVDFGLLSRVGEKLESEKLTSSVVVPVLAKHIESAVEGSANTPVDLSSAYTQLHDVLGTIENTGYFVGLDRLFADDRGESARLKWVEILESDHAQLLQRFQLTTSESLHVLGNPEDVETPLVIALGPTPSSGKAMSASESCALRKQFRNAGIEAEIFGGIPKECM